ncbi:unnamed protein product [Rangifer tarandus platyrhynchus]|uniref:Uncharacterized protein n=1 Tax=Rangifer tarandus platyrhynchus TaxID=3082113 RepID=A0ABN8ZH59_RANTA|nr:unnamed protein product [Rangifer tarandus platyrhynchus]
MTPPRWIHGRSAGQQKRDPAWTAEGTRAKGLEARPRQPRAEDRSGTPAPSNHLEPRGPASVPGHRHHSRGVRGGCSLRKDPSLHPPPARSSTDQRPGRCPLPIGDPSPRHRRPPARTSLTATRAASRAERSEQTELAGGLAGRRRGGAPEGGGRGAPAPSSGLSPPLRAAWTRSSPLAGGRLPQARNPTRDLRPSGFCPSPPPFRSPATLGTPPDDTPRPRLLPGTLQFQPRPHSPQGECLPFRVLLPATCPHNLELPS